MLRTNLTVLLIVIGVQNSGAVDLKLLFWTIQVDRTLLFFLLFLAGWVGGMLVSWFIYRERKPKKTEET